MRRIVSFHPIDLGFFDGIIGPLTVGEKINPEQFLNAAVRVRATDWYAKRYKRALESLLTLLEPPPPPSSAGDTTAEAPADRRPRAASTRDAGRVGESAPTITVRSVPAA